MKKVIVDCDNTIGIKGCDVDDGLAILYLLGCHNVNILGITTTYGNSDIDTVYPNTKEYLKEIGYEHIQVVKGSGKLDETGNKAAEYLVETVNKNIGEISILATGSMTNLGKAYELDSNFFNKVKEIVLMGGITEPLVFQKKTMDELNLSCDPQASYNILKKGHDVSVMTGNNCLDALFTLEEYDKELFNVNIPIADYIYKKTKYWFDDNKEVYGINGFYNWDVLAAVYLAKPELFNDINKTIEISKENLKTGYLKEDGNGNKLNLPEIKDEKALKENIYSTWLNVSLDNNLK